MEFERLDKLLVDQGLAESRTQAQKLVNAGAVKAQLHGQWICLHKPAQKIASGTLLTTDTIPELRYVSRAGLKLEGALAHLAECNFIERAAPFTGKTVLDIGQSTGGFTDCLLQRQAERVVGVDVGHGQLAERLRAEPRVICLEGINARSMPVDKLLSFTRKGYDWVVMDVSFISQTLLHPLLPPLLASGGYFLSLVKPQFEVGAANLAKGGIVKNASLFSEVESRMIASATAAGLMPVTYFPSTIAGADGNREFFILCRKP